MNIIILNNSKGHSKTLHLPVWLPWALASVLLIVPALVGVGAYISAYHVDSPVFSDEVAQRWQSEVSGQRSEVAELNEQSQRELRALTLKLGDVQARLVRLDALGERLVEVAGIRADEFDFSSTPALGGPESTEDALTNYRPPSFVDALNDLTVTLDRREQQLNILENLLNNKHIERQASLSGRPVTRGWMSSRFGYRTDPFKGNLAMHKGVDFAGKEGSDVVATASGVVTYAAERYGYGLMVEINHGNGLSTRYGHAKELTVKTGDIVKPGETIAKMGSSGRSTGPHVHYEVLKDGRQVNPQPYIARARR